MNLLRDNGLLPHPTTTNFFLIPVGDAFEVSTRLLELGFMVRDCRSFGLPDYIRVAAQEPLMNQRFVQALCSVVQRDGVTTQEYRDFQEKLRE